MDRLLNSDHFSTFVGFLAAAFGVFVAVCLIVGAAVLLDGLAGWVR